MSTRSDGPRVAVVGGGIGGMATAAFLHRAGIGATVYEQAGELGEVGAGLVVAPNAGRLVRRLGVMDLLEESAVRMEVGWEFRRWKDGEVISSENLTEACEHLYGEHTYTVHRADFLDVIRAAVPDGAVRLGARCVAVEQDDDGVRLTFADGSVDRADVVVGADGVHSVVRSTVTDPSPPEYSGICAFRALVPADVAPAFARRHAHTLWIGPDHHLVHYPISAGRLVNLVAFAPAGDYTDESWSATATVEEFLSEFEGWDPRLTELISAAGTPGRWALLDRAPLTRWTSGRVTLLGDAAHPMFPFYAQGAAQALEDAATLAACLAAEPDPGQALRRYEEIRLPRTTRIQQVSHARAHINHLPDGPEQESRDAALADGDPLVANGWIYGHDPEAEFTGTPA
ncbi:FAD-dependent monooxygenase [Georgenia sp. EYE_87]|uniref:FAD-dependent monooxygenase n=1 Tax=Georgenia sp. EYE_87 TaxID=2853448 RepID=UPI0020034B5F|nr:FAD-dependent monooxygenase [Georgenia sp. EYE_87]MCK6210098.1 FAD-dependent monooxygenase [Georgenia sp. EYE_87]